LDAKKKLLLQVFVTLEFCSDNLELIVKLPNNYWKTEQLVDLSSTA